MVLQELSQDTVRLIKSTQVITTPVSVVKELLENSIDAGATAVTVRLEKFGFSVVEVRDNGHGIEEEDVECTAKPHFTSKIESFADLESLNTYGFRGEALASLCSVAEVSITTKTKDSVMGHTYTFNSAGSVSSKKPAAAPNGTTIMAKNLFKNLPVRRQYYSSSKRQKEELKKVEDMVLAFTLAAPTVHLSLSHDKCSMIQKSSVQNIQEVLMSTFPAIYKNLVLREKSIEDIHIKAYLPNSGPIDNPNLSRSTPDRFFVVINRRPVSHKSIEKVVKAYYSQKGQGSHGRYPMGVVTVSVPLASVDVNLEPNKTKILLRNENQVLETLQEILSELYGPLDQHKKSNDDNTSDPNHKVEITCTFGDLREESKTTEEENTENEDSFCDGKSKKDVSVCEENMEETAAFTKPSSVGSDRVKGTIRASDKCSSRVEKNMLQKPLQIRPLEGEQKNKTLNSRKSGSGSVQLTLNFIDSQQEPCRDKNNGRCASTPKNSTDACVPSLPESSVIPDDDFDDFLNESDLSVSKRSENELSGIAPLSLSNRDVLCQENAKENNPPTEHDDYETDFPTADFNDDKLHESLTGSDGIPVYKIPPLPLFDKVENGNDKCEKFIEQGKDISSGESLESIQEGKPEDPEEREASIGGAWSRGRPVEGKNIQTVRLVSAATLKCPAESNSAQESTKSGKRHVSSEASGLSSTPIKKTKIDALSPARYDHSLGTPMKKPSSPFILFARDIRRQVLRENPGADFAFVAKEMADRWKRLDQDSKNHYKELSKAEADKYHLDVKLIRERRARTSSSPLARGCKTGASLDRYIAPLTPYIKTKGRVIQQEPHVNDRPWLKHKKEIKCSLKTIQDKIKYRCPVKNNTDPFTILGQVTSTGGWLCLKGSDIIALNVYRVYELVLYNNLMKTFRLAMNPLDTTIPFNASNVGVDNWTALLKLPRELVPDRNFYCVTDPRLVANGFHVELFPGATTSVTISHGEITQMADSVKFYGMTDFKEILSVLAASPLASLHQSRPLKLQYWIKDEAVRMVRSAPNILRKDDVLEKVKKMNLLMDGSEDGQQLLSIDHNCIHGRPLYTKLQSLQDLPSAEQNNRNILNEIVS